MYIYIYIYCYQNDHQKNKIILKLFHKNNQYMLEKRLFWYYFMVISVNRQLFRYFGSYSGIPVIWLIVEPEFVEGI